MNKLLILSVFSFLAASCSQPDKKIQLEKLKKQRTELNEQITRLEKEITAGGEAEPRKIKNVAVTVIRPETFSHFIEVQGKVDADENITVSAKAGGMVSKIMVNEGDAVGEGQTLALLENQVLQQTIEEVKTSLAYATTLFEKQKNLWDQKIGTEVQYLTAKNNKESLEKKLATLNEQMDLSALKSPISGTVDAIDIKIGQTVLPGLPCIRVVNFSRLKVKGEVAEAYASRVKKGDNALLFFPDIQKEISSKITYAAKVINNTTRTFTVEAELNGNQADLHPNMISILKIADYRNDSAILVPINVIQNSEETKYVFTAIADGKGMYAKKNSIAVGRMYNGKAEIINGLKTSDKLITTGYQELNEGDPIEY